MERILVLESMPLLGRGQGEVGKRERVNVVGSEDKTFLEPFLSIDIVRKHGTVVSLGDKIGNTRVTMYKLNKTYSLKRCNERGRESPSLTQDIENILYGNYMEICALFSLRCTSTHSLLLVHAPNHFPFLCSGTSGSTFQITSAYSWMHLSLLKKPILLTLVMHFSSQAS